MADTGWANFLTLSAPGWAVMGVSKLVAEDNDVARYGYRFTPTGITLRATDLWLNPYLSIQRKSWVSIEGIEVKIGWVGVRASTTSIRLVRDNGSGVQEVVGENKSIGGIPGSYTVTTLGSSTDRWQLTDLTPLPHVNFNFGVDFAITLDGGGTFAPSDIFLEYLAMKIHYKKSTLFFID